MGAIQCCQTCGALLSGGDGPCVRCGKGAPVASVPKVSSSRGFTVIPVKVAKAHDARTSPAQVLQRPRSVPPGPAPAFSALPESALQLDHARMRQVTPPRVISTPALPTARTRSWWGRLLKR